MALGHVQKYPCEGHKHTWRINSRATEKGRRCMWASVEKHKRLTFMNQSKKPCNLCRDASFCYFLICLPSEVAGILDA